MCQKNVTKILESQNPIVTKIYVRFGRPYVLNIVKKTFYKFNLFLLSTNSEQ